MELLPAFWCFSYSIQKKKINCEKSCFNISVWMHYIKHFFQTYCLSLPCLHLSSTKCWISVLPAAFSSVTWFTAEFFSFVLIVTPPYSVFSIQYSWCPSLLFSPSPSHQSQKGIHITLKLPFRSQAETISWNN